MIFPHAGLEPVACTVSLLSCIRPTMSKFRYAAIASSGTGGVVENALDPISPSSSPGPEADEDVALARLLRQRRGDREDGRRSRRVVVGAEMNLARHRPCRPACCPLRRDRGDRSARRSRPTALAHASTALSPADRPTTLWPVRFSRSTAACTLTVMPGSAKPVACGLASSSDFCAAASGLSGVAAKIFAATSPVTLTATIPDPAIAVSNVIGASSPAFGDCGPVTTIDRLRAVLPGGHRLVAQVGVARRGSPCVFGSASSGK